MNSIQDLNNKSNEPVTYNSYTDYEIAYGNSAGNISVERFENSYFNLLKQVPLATFTNPINPLLINFSVSNAAFVNDVVYFGTNSNINIYNSTGNSWSVTGINTIADYNEAFANVHILTTSDLLGNFVLSTTADDQRGNTASWTVDVAVVDNTLISYPANITYAEDTLASMGNIAIIDTFPDVSYTWNIVDTGPNPGQFKYPSGTIVNEIDGTGIKSAFNGAQANTLYVPAADYTGNSNIRITMIRSNDGTSSITNVPVVWNGTQHSDYNIANPVVYCLEDSVTSIGNIAITDIRPNTVDANIQYSMTVASTDTGNVKIRVANGLGVLEGNSVTITGTKASLNARMANTATQFQAVTFNDFVGNANITYTQIQTTNSVTQANAVPIQLVVTSVPVEYTLTTSYAYDLLPTPDYVRLVYSILDTDPLANSYQVTVARTSGNLGNIFINGVDAGLGPVTFANTKANVNSANISVAASATSGSPAGLTWSLSKTNPSGNVVIANAVPITFTSSVSNLDISRSYTANTKTRLFQTSTPQISSLVTGNITLTVTSANGYVGTDTFDAFASWSYTGNRTQVNAIFDDIYFWPLKGQTGNITLGMTIVSDGSTVANVTLPVTGINAPIPTGLFGTNILQSNGAYATSLERHLYCRADIELIGGGGAGAWGGGGGGGGGIVSAVNLIMPLPWQTSQLQIATGSGGQTQVEYIYLNSGISYRTGNGNPGGNTTFLGYTAGGGFGGLRAINEFGTLTSYGPDGGNSGSPQSRAGAQGTASNPQSINLTFTGGGGGGAGTAAVGKDGGNGLQLSLLSSGNTTAAGGGAGASSTAYGNNGSSTLTYGNGGRGASWFTGSISPQNGTNGAVIITWHE